MGGFQRKMNLEQKAVDNPIQGASTPIGRLNPEAVNSQQERDLASTPVVPYEPVKSEKCKAYSSMPEGLRRLLCSQCDHFGNVRYQLGIGHCRRYKEGI